MVTQQKGVLFLIIPKMLHSNEKLIEEIESLFSKLNMISYFCTVTVIAIVILT